MNKALLFLAFLTITFSANATDLCVNENGNGGCYTTITAAHNAATNGDRIIITPKAGNAPYTENLTITKSLQLLCATEASQYTVQGTFSIAPAAGRTVTIIGMRNLQGGIVGTTDGPSGARTKVNLMNCNLLLGDVSFDYNNYDLSLASSVIAAGSVTFRFGKVIGNEITGSAYALIYISADATATNDTILVIGNKIMPAGSYAIRFSTASQFFSMQNNYIKTGSGGLYLEAAKNSTLGRNTIANNTIASDGSMGYAIQLISVPANSMFDVMNNLILATSGTAMYGYANSGLIGISYNVISSPLTIQTLTYDVNNNLTSNTTLDVNGRPNGGSDAINGGSPDFSYYDINLTVNDAGAYGGSFTLDNFFPQTGGARVYYVQAPRRVNVGTAIDIKAETFDR